MRWRVRMALARTRERVRPAPRPREELIRRHVAGASFADIGCMWSVDGALSFAAEEAGATAVTGVDLMPATERFEHEHAGRRSAVRFVQGDVHDPRIVEQIGPHDVVWCSGVLYHAPHPLLTLERLRALTRRTLLLATETIPEAPGLRRGCLFAPPPAAHPGVPEPLDPAGGYRGWWWGLTGSAVDAMVEASGFWIAETHGGPLHRTVVAHPR